ncbi:hypothetical protein HDU79_008926 [Rhizoclosmatium sp. JEL0117]|nr:hypothetical protein HDU79_008926 [Rhizoclosmatium sp. JEL0117]
MIFQALVFAASVSAGILTPTRGALPWSELNFLSTTDIHGFVNGQGGNMQGQYSANFADFAVFVDNMKAKAAEKGVELFLIDCGDQHDGTVLSDNIKAPGQTVDAQLTLPAIRMADYDVLSIGNHEMYTNDIIDQVTNEVAPSWKGRFITGNTYSTATGKPVGAKVRQFVGTQGTKVTAFGFVFQTFNQAGSNIKLTNVTDEVKQSWFTDAVSQPADLFILGGHIALRNQFGNTDKANSIEWDAAIKAIRAINPTTPIAVFGGHYHLRDFKNMGVKAYGISAGRYMETVAFMSMTKDGSKVDRRYLDANVPTYNFHLGRDENAPLANTTEKGNMMLKIIANAAAVTNSSLVVGKAPQDYYLSRVGINDTNSLYKLVGDYMAPTWQKPAPANSLYAIMNSGGLRYDIFAGDVTLDAAFQATPFNNKLILVPDVPFSAIKNFARDMEEYEKTIAFHRRGDGSTCTATLGYVTTDDLSATNPGDDTLHCAISNVKNPNYAVYSPRVLPCAPLDQKWDLIFVDYIEKDVKAVLAKYYNISTPAKGQSPQYIPGKASADLFTDLAQKFWQPKSVQPKIETGVCATTAVAATATVAPTVVATTAAASGYVAPPATALYSGGSTVVASALLGLVALLL